MCHKKDVCHLSVNDITVLSFTFRYSHSAHVINEKLVVVGGVWLQADGVPGVAVINLNTGGCVEIQLDTVSYSAHRF